MNVRAPILLAGLCLALSCDAATGGREVRYDLAATSAAVSTFHTAAGWDVTLSEACVSLGPIYVFSGEPTARSTLYDWLVPSAHAHPGVDHFAGGEARGEWLATVAVDALASAPVHVGRLSGPAGPARTLSLYLSPPRPETAGPAGCLRGHQAYVVGIAQRDGVTVAFEGGLDIEEAGNRRRIQVPVSFEVDDGATLAVLVDPRPWLDEVRFDDLTVTEPGGRATIAAESQARVAWFLGVQRASAFSARIH
ncbi:MAG: hypothetical protein KIT84_40905 [Labilithrix sp.]|nr:hypothetical protein [Labilithrix sp.]MCW5817430.1 hypothetical protein [Labilithrix sp.]